MYDEYSKYNIIYSVMKQNCHFSYIHYLRELSTVEFSVLIRHLYHTSFSQGSEIILHEGDRKIARAKKLWMSTKKLLSEQK